MDTYSNTPSNTHSSDCSSDCSLEYHVGRSAWLDDEIDSLIAGLSSKRVSWVARLQIKAKSPASTSWSDAWDAHDALCDG